MRSGLPGPGPPKSPLSPEALSCQPLTWQSRQVELLSHHQASLEASGLQRQEVEAGISATRGSSVGLV